MLKKVMALVAILVLVLATAQLALAQQYPTPPVQETPQQRDTSGTQPTGAGQTTPADTAAGQSPGQDQPATPGSQSSPSPAAGLMFLNQNGQLLIDCPAVSNALAQPGLTQTEQVELQELSQLCADGGFVPANSGGGNQPSPNGTDATQQPQQSQDTSTPPDGGGNNGLGPNDTSSNPPQRSVAAQ
jgi:hypothetical protein